MSKDRFFALFFVLCFFCFKTHAQISVHPLINNPAQQNEPDHSRHRVAATPIDTLPFFDDFAGYTGQPDPAKWEKEGGVWINNSYGVNPPSIHVATFDGLNYRGAPYNPSNQYARGQADRLTSVPLNLSGYTAGDSLYLSFFWQAGGLGENPDPSDGDYLRLDFKNSSNIWTTVWQAQDISTPFIQHIMPILDPLYFHESFQFRFQNYGSTAGAYDVWNLDYVLLSPGRTKADTNYADMAIQTSPGSILKDYSALPYLQFFNHLDNVVKDKLSFRVYNFSTPDELYLMDNPPEKLNKLLDATTGDVLDEFIVQGYAFGKTHNTIDWTPDYDPLRGMDKPMILKYVIDPEVTDSSLFKANNMVKDSTFLLNYMAYDDHSIEAVLSLENIKAEVGVQYTSLQPDSIIGIAIDFQPYRNTWYDMPLEICLWKSLTAGTDSEDLIASHATRLSYSDANSIAKFYFDKPYRVDGSFYIGFKGDFTSKIIDIGFDIHNNTKDKILYKESTRISSTTWQNYPATDIDGSVLIRPIFGGAHYAAMPPMGITRTLEVLQANIFPNPSSGNVSISGPVQKLTLHNAAGVKIMTETYSGTDETRVIELSRLPAGIYYMLLSGRDSFTTKKLILTDN